MEFHEKIVQIMQEYDFADQESSQKAAVRFVDEFKGYFSDDDLEHPNQSRPNLPWMERMRLLVNGTSTLSEEFHKKECDAMHFWNSLDVLMPLEYNWRLWQIVSHNIICGSMILSADTLDDVEKVFDLIDTVIQTAKSLDQAHMLDLSLHDNGVYLVKASLLYSLINLDAKKYFAKTDYRNRFREALEFCARSRTLCSMCKNEIEKIETILASETNNSKALSKEEVIDFVKHHVNEDIVPDKPIMITFQTAADIDYVRRKVADFPNCAKTSGNPFLGHQHFVDQNGNVQRVADHPEIFEEVYYPSTYKKDTKFFLYHNFACQLEPINLKYCIDLFKDSGKLVVMLVDNCDMINRMDLSRFDLYTCE